MLIFFLLTSFSIQAQNNSNFRQVEAPQDLSTAKVAYVDRLTSDPATKSLKYVSYDSTKMTTMNPDVFRFKIGTTQFNVERMRYKRVGKGYSWLGKLPNDEGYMSLDVQAGMLSGFIQASNGFWEIVPLRNELTILREIDMVNSEVADCSHITYPDLLLESNATESVDLCEIGEGCGGIIDILFLIPPDVIEWFGANKGWEAFFAFVGSIRGFEIALLNSNITNIEIRFHLKNFDFQYNEDFIWQTDLFTTLPNTAESIRNDYRADLVVLLTSIDYNNINGSSINSIFGPEEDAAYVLAEVQKGYAPTWTVAHELGHLLGAGHNRSANVPCPTTNSDCGDDDDDCAHALRFGNGGKDRTVVSIISDAMIDAGSEYALLFSSPDVYSGGVPTGDINNNNAQAIRNGACEVINFRPDPFFSVSLDALEVVCASNNSFTASVSAHEAAPVYNGHPPYQYPNFSASSSDGSPVSLTYVSPATRQINFNYNNCTITVNASVTASDGITKSASRDIVISPTCKNETNLDNIPAFEIYPNPVADKLYIRHATTEQLSFTLNDINGKMYDLKTATNYETVFDMSHLPKGIYFLQINDTEKITSKKIIKL